MAKKHLRSASKPPAGSPASGGLRAQPPRPASSQPASTTGARETGRRAALVGATGLLFLAGLHLGWRVEPVLRYQQSVPPFFLDAPFFARFPSVPGGLLDYLAAGVSQLNAHNWLGAAAFTVLLGCILLCARRVFTSLTTVGATAPACGLVALMAAFPGRYESEMERTLLGVLVSLGAATACLAVPMRQRTSRWLSCWALAAAVFYVAETLPTVLFVIVVAWNALAVGRQPRLALGCVLALLVVPFWAWYQPAFAPFTAMNRWGNGLTLAFHALAFLFVPAWLVMETVLARWTGGMDRAWARPYAWMAGIIATLALWWWSLDASQQALAQLELAVSRQEWDRAWTVARRVRVWTAGARLELTRALSHTGRLPEDLFAFPQTRGLDLLPGYDAGLAMARAEAQTLLELGQVNLAEHMAHESLELAGARPDTLRLLAQVYILKDLPEAARVFLNRLRLTPFRRTEAERQLQLLAADPGGANQTEIGAIRTRLPRTDEPDAGLPTEALLRQLLKANPTNRMAFDYLLAHQLLNLHLDELPADLGRLDGFGDPILPRPCEEALLFYRDRAPAKPVDLRGRQIRPATIERYRRFSDLIRRHQGQPAAARAVLAPEFGDTFWFYALFGETVPVSAAATRPPKP